MADVTMGTIREHLQTLQSVQQFWENGFAKRDDPERTELIRALVIARSGKGRVGDAIREFVGGE